MKQKKNATKRLTQIIKTGSYPQLALQLNREGYRTPKGLKWKAQNIASWAFEMRKGGTRKVKTKKETTSIESIGKILSNPRFSSKVKVSMLKQIVL